MEFCRALPRRAGVVAIPSSVFYDDQDAGRTQVRFAFCKKEEVLREALRRLARRGALASEPPGGARQPAAEPRAVGQRPVGLPRARRPSGAPAGPSVASSDDAFGADLYQRLPAAGNLVFSRAVSPSLSAWCCSGPGGDGCPDRRSPAPGPPGPGRAGTADRPALLGDLAAGDLTLRAPSTVWVQSGLPLEPGFTAALAAAADVAATVSLRDADFRRDAEQARQEINQVIAEQTAGRISDLLGPGVLDASTSLVLASAVYLKAAWAHPFPAGATHGAPFHPDSGIQVTVPTMRLGARLRYVRGDGFQAVGLPYAGSRLGLLIVLPDGPAGGSARCWLARCLASRMVARPASGRTAAAWGGCWPGWRPGRSAWRCPASG